MLQKDEMGREWGCGLGMRTQRVCVPESQARSLTHCRLVHSLGVGVCGLPAVHELTGAESACLQGCPNETEDFRYVSKDEPAHVLVCVDAGLFPNDAA